MKRISSVLVKPLAARLGSLAAGAVAGSMALDPSLASRVEAWVAASVLLAADLVGAYYRSRSMEGR